jgi:hypothetical protein
MKYCGKCKEEKSREEFSKDIRAKYGLHSNCKVCNKASSKKHYEVNRDKIKAYYEENKDKIKAYREENKDKIKENSKAWYEGNRDKIKENSKAWYEGNRDKKAAYREENKDKIKEYSKAWYEGNRDKKAAYDKAWYEGNRDKKAAYDKAYSEENRDNRNAHMRNRYQQEPLYALSMRIRCAIRGALQKKGYRKSSNTMKIIGCSFEEFYEYIEVQFHSGMTWDNRSLWHLDHIVPVAFGVNEEEIIRLNHHSNFRPLWAEENMEKSDKLTEEALQHPIYHDLLSRR